MNHKTFLQPVTIAMLGGLALSLSSCAALRGNPNCHCSSTTSCGGTPATMVIANGQSALGMTSERPANPELAAILATDPDELYAIKKYVPDAPQRLVWVDSPVTETIDELQPYFAVKDGRFMPRAVTMSNTDNDLFFYFVEDSNGRPEALRLRIQYYADDPLQFYEVVFWVDGFDYHFKPANKTAGKGKKPMIWECSDDPLTAADRDLVYALTHGESVKVNLLGGNKGINHIKSLSEDQIEALYALLQLYRLKGGTFQ